MKEFVKYLFWSSRPVSWVNTAYPFAAAYVLIEQKATLLFWIATLFFLIPYNVLMYGVNDVFDYESDLNNPRKGGVEGALLPPKWHKPVLVTSTALALPFVAVMAALGTWQANVVLAVVLFMVVAYSAKYLRFKEIPLLDSATSSIHFVGPMVYALVLCGWSSSFMPYVLAFFAWGMASHAFGAVQDIIPDREAKIASIATAWGAKRVVRFATVLYIVSGVLLMLQPWPVPIVGLCAWLYLSSTLPYMHVTDATSEKVNRGWKRFMWLNMLSGAVVTILIVLVLRSA